MITVLFLHYAELDFNSYTYLNLDVYLYFSWLYAKDKTMDETTNT